MIAQQQDFFKSIFKKFLITELRGQAAVKYIDVVIIGECNYDKATFLNNLLGVRDLLRYECTSFPRYIIPHKLKEFKIVTKTSNIKN
jgi:predicted GTPase